MFGKFQEHFSAEVVLKNNLYRSCATFIGRTHFCDFLRIIHFWNRFEIRCWAIFRKILKTFMIHFVSHCPSPPRNSFTHILSSLRRDATFNFSSVSDRESLGNFRFRENLTKVRACREHWANFAMQELFFLLLNLSRDLIIGRPTLCKHSRKNGIALPFIMLSEYIFWD